LLVEYEAPKAQAGALGAGLLFENQRN